MTGSHTGDSFNMNLNQFQRKLGVGLTCRMANEGRITFDCAAAQLSPRPHGPLDQLKGIVFESHQRPGDSFLELSRRLDLERSSGFELGTRI